MGILGEFATGLASGLRAETGDRNPDDERWWRTGPVSQSSAGVMVTPEVAFQVSVLFLGVKLISETVATIPLKFFEEIDVDEREIARDYWLKPVLDTKRGMANPWQTAVQWREAMTARLVAWGAGYSEIKPGARGAAVELWPLDNDRIRIEQQTDGRLRFQVTRDDGSQPWLPQERVLRFEGLSLHRFIPANILALAREFIGSWLAVEKYEGQFFSQGAKPSLFIEHPGKPDAATKARLVENVKQWQGLRNMHKVFIGELGMKPHEVGFSPRDAMLPELRVQLALEACRWLNLPPHMAKAGGSSGTEEAAASMEQLAQEYVDYTIRPLCVRQEAAYVRDLIVEPEIYPEHILDGLLRGDIQARFGAYAIGIMNGFMSENEVRVKENMNRIPGLDTPVRSVNQDRGGGEQQDRQTDPRQTQSPQGSTSRRLRLLAQESARRVVRREIGKVEEHATKLAGKPQEWAAWLVAFYDDHRGFVAEALQLEPALARAYTDRHRSALLAGGAAAAEDWETTAVAELTAMTVNEEPCHA